MQYIKIVLCALLMTGVFAFTAIAGETSGHKIFGCFDLEWEMTRGQQVNVRFAINDETLTQFTLSQDEPFHQFYLSSETNTAEGRMRMRYKPAKGKAYLKMDNFNYRCSSPMDRSFSGILAEFEVPGKNVPETK